MGKTIRVASVGPALCVQGGISRVIGLIGDHLPAHVKFRHFDTFNRFTGDKDATPSERGSRVGQALVFAVAALQLLLRALRRRTIFHIHFAGGGSLIRKSVLCVMLRLLRCEYAVHSHAAGTELFPSWLPAPCRRIILWGLAGAAYVIVLTEFWKQYYASLLKLPEDRFLVLPNPANLPPNLPDRSAPTQIRLLFLGRVGQRKGAFDLIRAFAMLPEDVRGRCVLTMAGDGEIHEARALCAELGCSGQVAFPGWAGSEKVNDLLRESHVLLLPSYAEGMAMALIEAMSWGLAVVTTGVGGASEFLEHRSNCILVTPGDVVAISQAISELVREPSLRNNLGLAARQTISQFSVDRYVVRLVAIYEEMSSRLPSRQKAVARLASADR